MQKFSDIIHTIPLKSKQNTIYIFGVVLLFFVLFDGIITYLIPLITLEHGFSKTMIGVIISSAAVAGAFFDFSIYKIIKNPTFRRLFIIMFGVSFLYLLLIWTAHSFVLYMCAMTTWGFYFDLKNFGTMDFTCRYYPKQQATSSFGILQIFQSLGYVLAPLIAGFFIINTVGNAPFITALIFLCISVVFFCLLVVHIRKAQQYIPEKTVKKTNISEEILHWKKTGKILWPVLLLGSMCTLIDSFFVTLGPLFAENLPIEPFDGVFMFAYLFPALMTGILVGKIAKKFGEKNSAIIGLLTGSCALSFFYFLNSPIAIIFIVFIAFCFISIVSPIVHSIYAHYIHASPETEKETKELGDFVENIGYVLGPIIAGLLADHIKMNTTFSILGLAGVIVAIILVVLMPKNLNHIS